MIPLAIGVGVVVFLLILILPLAIKIVREYQRLMVFRLGRAIGAKGPGLVLLIPFVDKGVWVDLRELYLEIPHQAAITEDNATISIDFIVFYRVVDARMSVIEVGNFAGAAQNIAATTLRSVVGDMSLDDVLAKREAMNEILRVKLDEVTERGGARQVGAVAGEVDARQDDLAVPGVDETRDAIDDRTGGDRTARAATEGDRAEGATAVATGCDLERRGRAAVQPPSHGSGTAGRGAVETVQSKTGSIRSVTGNGHRAGGGRTGGGGDGQ